MSIYIGSADNSSLSSLITKEKNQRTYTDTSLQSQITGFSTVVNTAKVESVGSTLTIAGQNSTSTLNIGTGSSVQSVNIGTGSGSTTIVIGAAGDTVTLAGTVTNANSTNLNISDNYIALNVGGNLGSSTSSGLAIEAGTSGTYPGYCKVNSDRKGWIMKGTDPAAVECEITQSLTTTDNVRFNNNDVNILTAKSVKLLSSNSTLMTIQPSATQSAYSLTLPSSLTATALNVDTSYVLTTTAAGVLSWTSAHSTGYPALALRNTAGECSFSKIQCQALKGPSSAIVLDWNSAAATMFVGSGITTFRPETTNTCNLGSSSVRFKNSYLSGKLNMKSDNTNTIDIGVPASLAASYSLTLPPNNSQGVLVNNGAGVLNNLPYSDFNGAGYFVTRTADSFIRSDSINAFTFVTPSTQGNQLSWNRDGDSGTASFVNAQGSSGTLGGWEWLSYTFGSSWTTTGTPTMKLSKTGVLTVPSVVGNLTGNVTGDVSGYSTTVSSTFVGPWPTPTMKANLYRVGNRVTLQFTSAYSTITYVGTDMVFGGTIPAGYMPTLTVTQPITMFRDPGTGVVPAMARAYVDIYGGIYITPMEGTWGAIGATAGFDGFSMSWLINAIA